MPQPWGDSQDADREVLIDEDEGETGMTSGAAAALHSSHLSNGSSSGFSDQDVSIIPHAEDSAASSASGHVRALSLFGYHLDRRQLLTFTLCSSFFALGLVMALLGPTLIDIGHRLGFSSADTQSKMAKVFTARSVGYLFGSMFGGYFFEMMHNTCLTLGVVMVLNAVGTALIPVCKSVWTVMTVITTQGICMGFLDTGGNVLILLLWGKACGPYMQALHFSFGLGTFFAPLLAQHFIGSNLPASQVNCPVDNPTVNGTTTTTTASPEDSVVESDVQWAFWVCTIVILIVAMLFFFLSRQAPKGGEKSAREAAHEHNAHRREGLYRTMVLLLACTFLCVYVGLEVSYGGYLFSYAVKYCPIQLEESKAAYLTSVYWGFFALFRLVAVGLAMKCHPIVITIADLLGTILSSGLMLILHKSETMLWIGTAMFGASMSSIFPSAYHLVEEYIDVSGKAASIIVVGAATGEMALPLFTGYMFDSSYGPVSMLYIVCIGCILAFFVFLVFIVWGHKGKDYAERRASRTSLPSNSIGDGEL
eukprot:m.89932 g.89932  ORF g.89932 m.89932 type:complete len:535 (-) comp15242_c0_seq2:315-1919(-)